MRSVNLYGHFLDVSVRLLLVYLLAQAFARKYFIVLVYCSVYILTSFAEILAGRFVRASSVFYINLYWTDEVFVDLLLFLTVILLTYQAAEGSPFRPAARKVLIAVVAVALISPFLLGGFQLWQTVQNETRLSGRWFNRAGQIFNFGGAIMNLVLWTTLLSSKRRDPRLLAVSAGLGVAVTAQTIFLGVRLLTRSGNVRQAAESFYVLGQIAGGLIWCWAFRPSSRQIAPAAGAPSKA